jgi:cell wall-associated NlpC family hydrolase
MRFRVKHHTFMFRLLALVVLLCMSSSATVFAVPQSKLNEAQAAKTRADELAVQLSQIVDEYNGAQESYDAATVKRQEAETQLEATSDRLGVVQGNLNRRAANMYRQGPLALLDVLLGAASFSEFTATWDILSDINAQNAQNIDELSKLRAEQIQLKGVLNEQEQIAAQKAQEMASKKSQIETQVAQQNQVVAGLEEEVAQLRAQEAAAAEAASTSNNQPTYTGGWDDYTPPTNPPSSGVVGIAAQYLGVPYVWGGTSPAGFDCSGLVQYVYAQVGISLPRTTYGMLNVGQAVGPSELQPGDLIFTHAGHVGIYVGGGSMIHAPTPGMVVSYGSASPFYAARRP